MNKEKLNALYIKTTYTVHTKKIIFNIRIGETNTEFQIWLAKNNIQTWAMITAANPYSIELSEEENKERNAKFELQLQKEKIDYCRSEGRPDAPNWTTELGFFIANINLNFAKELAKSAKQNAIVFGRGKPLR